jgi:hypothetical protein
MRNEVLESLKEPLRIILLAILAWLLAGGIEFILGLFTIDAEIRLQLTGLLILILRAVDKYVHNTIDVKGITRF